jgi:hypothetical protein
MNKVKFVSFLIVLSFFTNLVLTPSASASDVGKEVALQSELKAIAKKTYKYFQDHTAPNTGMTYDEVRFTDEGKTEATHTSPTNIAMYMMSTVSAEQMGIIRREDAVKRLQISINTLEKLDKWNGLYYNWYYTKDGSLKKDWGQFISQVDNGWLSAGLIVVGQAYKELNGQTSKLVENMDYSTLYDAEVGQFRGGYDVAAGKLTDHHYGMFYTDSKRIYHTI